MGDDLSTFGYEKSPTNMSGHELETMPVPSGYAKFQLYTSK